MLKYRRAPGIRRAEPDAATSWPVGLQMEIRDHKTLFETRALIGQPAQWLHWSTSTVGGDHPIRL